MNLTVLGSAAGGGFPQWNCGCPNCIAVREGRANFEPRTQDSLAVTARDPRDASYVLVNASPDLLEQIKRTRPLWPKAPRHSPIRAIVLTNGDMDHVLGLFSLRESYPLALYATSAVRRGLEENAFLRTLQRFEGQLVLRTLEIGREVEIRDASGETTGVHIRAFAAPGKLPVHLMASGTASDEDNVGLVLHDGTSPKKTAVYLTACADLERRTDLEGHAVLLFDGTFYCEDELRKLELSRSLAKDMAHIPIEGETGSLARLASIPGCRKIYTHINNTNPILSLASEERRTVERAGFEIAFDGMEITL
ncbi:pyrroloquinoline quinone biosynthesis protein PqqB [Pendulispora albinea]|uniref:Coenzyme PQQ synthesis protein B n=1 Tax=Pendulispora albinea TaxID=2741071 RepID=A0ABZ2LX70_9BACT